LQSGKIKNYRASLRKKRLYQSLKDPKKIKACFDHGITFQKNGLFCKVLIPEKNADDQGIHILIAASSQVKKKVKKNRIKRIIKEQLRNLLQRVNRDKITLAYLVLIGNEEFSAKKFDQRARILDHIITEARLIKN
jgi:ribonuclease P protein component